MSWCPQFSNLHSLVSSWGTKFSSKGSLSSSVYTLIFTPHITSYSYYISTPKWVYIKLLVISKSSVAAYVLFATSSSRFSVTNFFLLLKETSIWTFSYGLGVPLDFINFNIRMISETKEDSSLITTIDIFHLPRDYKTVLKVIVRYPVGILVSHIFEWVECFW